jgi:hypothetical protein
MYRRKAMQARIQEKAKANLFYQVSKPCFVYS